MDETVNNSSTVLKPFLNHKLTDFVKFFCEEQAMTIARSLTLTLSAVFLAGTATAQVVIHEPVPEQFEGIVRAQHIKPGDVSAEEYAKLLEEADKVRTYQRSYLTPRPVTGTANVIPNNTMPEQVTTPSNNVRIELLNTPIEQSAAITTPTEPSVAKTHTVIKGDTLYNISKRYDVTLKELKAANKLPDNAIQLGQLLIIPGTATSRITESIAAPTRPTLVRTIEPVPTSNVYAVLPGDTLYNISKQACLTVGQLAALNNISDVSSLAPGQRLVLPAGHCLR